MAQRPIMDAGPGLNFFSIHKERLLFEVLGALCVPEAVRDEIERKARDDHRFEAAERVLAKLPERLMSVLPDDATDELASAVHRICGIPIEERRNMGKDLGETMVVAHAAVAAEAGANVLVLIDDRGGIRMATSEARRLDRIRKQGQPVGRIQLVRTVTVLEQAARKKAIPDRQAMRKLYERLRTLDDGLEPLEQTSLMSLQCWTSSS